MTPAADPNLEALESSSRPAKKSVRTAQSIGAAIVTALLLWFLFGIPAYLLFGIFFN
jgi:hypothetical protein